MTMRKHWLAALGLLLAAGVPSMAQTPPPAATAQSAGTAPPFIKIGALYASSGPYASISFTCHKAIELWADLVNAQGGVFVKGFGKKIPVKLIEYDDQSSTATAATLYDQLITQDKVNILLADSGSVLTSVAVPIAREHKQLLIDQTGTAANFFTPDNKYIVLANSPSSDTWAGTLGHFLQDKAAGLGIKRIAMLYSTNDFTGAMAARIRAMVKADPKLELVYDQGTPTNTSNYTVLINNIAASNPDAVIEFGYPPNDIAFLRGIDDGGAKFKYLFTVYSGDEFDLVSHDVGKSGMMDVSTFMTATDMNYKVDYGMTATQYRAAWDKKYAGDHLAFGVNALAGYNVGLVLEKALAVADSLDQLELRRAIMTLSGHLDTLNGSFKLDDTGKQIGDIQPIGQVIAGDSRDGLGLVPYYPDDVARAKLVYPRP
jgi:branched-chain amino acid transport system substrate-binding protein